MPCSVCTLCVCVCVCVCVHSIVCPLVSKFLHYHYLISALLCKICEYSLNRLWEMCVRESQGSCVI